MRLLFIALFHFLVTSCATQNINSSSDYGIVFFSSDIINGCEGDSQFKNAILNTAPKGSSTSSIYTPIADITLEKKFIIQNTFASTAFNKNGIIHFDKMKPGDYVFTYVSSVPITFVHLKTDPLNIHFHVEKGKITYLGEFAFGKAKCTTASESSTYKDGTVVIINDKYDRDFSLLSHDNKNINAGLIIKNIAFNNNK